MRERRIKTCFKHIILFSITFLFIHQNSYAGQTYEIYRDCFIPRGIFTSYAILKGQTVTINNNPLITYTAPETGFYKFFIYDYETHLDSWKCSDPSVYYNWIYYCTEKPPPLELDAWPSNYVWRYIGQFTVSYDYGVTEALGGCNHTYGWETLSVYFYTKKEDCDVTINISPSEVWPQKAGNDDKTTATIMVTATNPPPEGCTVDLKVEPVENSGGHSHGGSRLKGTVTPTTLTIPGGSSGAASAEYKASEVAGEEKIIAEIKGVKKGEATIQVKVPGLVELSEGDGYGIIELIGQTSSHPENHYGTENAKSSLLDLASAYLETEKGTLKINDISLIWGGLFDIKANWSSPHKSHRLGKNIDVDDVTVEGKKVTSKSLKKIAKKISIKITILDEGNHLHLTFP